MAKKQKIVIICGPTASGKTGLALQLAKELPSANILSVDSRQIYQELDIVTGKDIPSHLPSEINFYGLNLFKPTEVANLADFTRYATEVIDKSYKSGTPLIIVGGTGLYLKSITERLSDILVPPNPELRKELEQLPLSYLQQKLKETNPAKYQSLNRSDIMNPRRLIRSIEISLSKPVPSAPQQPGRQVEYFWVGLRPDKNALKTSINLRVKKRLEQGAVKEVENLMSKYSSHSLPVFSSLGVSQIRQHIDKKITQSELIEIWTNAEVDYARRQMVWFKKQPHIVWYDKDADRKKLIDNLIKIYNPNA